MYYDFTIPENLLCVKKNHKFIKWWDTWKGKLNIVNNSYTIYALSNTLENVREIRNRDIKPEEYIENTNTACYAELRTLLYRWENRYKNFPKYILTSIDPGSFDKIEIEKYINLLNSFNMFGESIDTEWTLKNYTGYITNIEEKSYNHLYYILSNYRNCFEHKGLVEFINYAFEKYNYHPATSIACFMARGYGTNHSYLNSYDDRIHMYAWQIANYLQIYKGVPLNEVKFLSDLSFSCNASFDKLPKIKDKYTDYDLETFNPSIIKV